MFSDAILFPHVAHEAGQHIDHGLPCTPRVEDLCMVEVMVPEHLQPVLLPAELRLVLPREVLVDLARTDDLVPPAEHDADAAAREVLLPEQVLRPEEVARQRARDVRVATREVPQLPLVRGVWYAVHEVVRHRGQEEQERDWVDEQRRRDAGPKRVVAEDVSRDDSAVGMSHDGDAWEVVVVKHAGERREYRIAREWRVADARADCQVLDSDDAYVGVCRDKLSKEGQIWPEADLKRCQGALVPQ